MTSIMRWSEPMLDMNESIHGEQSQLAPHHFQTVRTPSIKNHSVTYYNNHLFCFGGYDGRRNHMTLMIYSIHEHRWKSVHAGGTPPPGRNGHTATLTFSRDGSPRIIIIGGWLGTGPLAADDTHVLDVNDGLNNLRWFQPPVQGTPPGPCNMHSADYVGDHRREVYVFRGGNGREYLNDLHALNVDTYKWRKVNSSGKAPQQRANHSSAVLDETSELFIFGGWNGKERLNDIYILDTKTSVWSAPRIFGEPPHPRAGMTLTALRGRLYLFGGSGTSSKCFHDLQIFDRKEMTWLNVKQQEDSPHNNMNSNTLNQQLRDDTKDDHFQDNLKSLHWGTPRSQIWSSISQPYNNDNDLNTSETSHLNPYSASNAFSHYANPNDEESMESITIQGRRPGRRAGHTATAVNRHIYVFGGSCGSDYLSDFFVLDTDPCPQVQISKRNPIQLFESRLKYFFNDDEFSDVSFLVEGQIIHGHRMVLSLISDCFCAMFTNGFRESNTDVIPIPDYSYVSFYSMMEYIYTGKSPKIIIKEDNKFEGINQTIEIMELANQFFLDHLKEVCERILQTCVCSETYEFLLSAAEKNNARQLENTCRHFQRNQEELILENEARRDRILRQQSHRA